MRVLVDMGYRVDFLPDDGRHAGAYSEALATGGVATHFAPGAGAILRWLHRNAPGYAVIIVSRYHLAEALFPLFRHIAPDARLVLDTVDLHHLREQREAWQHGDARLLRLSSRTRQRELHAIAAADSTWVVSNVEKALLARHAPSANVHVVSNVHEVLTHVPGAHGRRGVLFVGGAGHPPNLDAIAWLLEEIWPEMHAAVPDMELHLVGDGLTKAVPTPPVGVTVHGYVQDLEPLLARVRVAIAPLRFGAGVKGKVNLGMSHGVPMVITECAAEGMDITEGKDAFIENSPAGFADAVARLHHDDALWTRMSAASISHVIDRFSVVTARAAMAASFSKPMSPAG
ncbi:MAG: glycosyltransferase [Luteimonas sp.]